MGDTARTLWLTFSLFFKLAAWMWRRWQTFRSLMWRAERKKQELQLNVLYWKQQNRSVWQRQLAFCHFNACLCNSTGFRQHTHTNRAAKARTVCWASWYHAVEGGQTKPRQDQCHMFAKSFSPESAKPETEPEHMGVVYSDPLGQIPWGKSEIL